MPDAEQIRQDFIDANERVRKADKRVHDAWTELRTAKAEQADAHMNRIGCRARLRRLMNNERQEQHA